MEACCSRFTPAEGGTRLAAAASDSNILAVEYASFIATRLVHEHGYKIRGSLLDGKQRSVYVTRASRVACVAYELQILTDLVVTQAKEYQDVDNWHTELDKKEIIVCTSRVLQQILHEQLLTMLNINVLILDSCHAISTDKSLQYIMNSYKMCEKDNRPRILALTYPLFNLNIKDTIETDTVNEDKIEPTIDEVDVEKVDIMDKEETIDKADVGDKVVDIVDTDDISEEKTENKEVEIEDSKKDPEIADVEAKTKAVDETLEIGVYENLDDFDMYEKLEWKIEEMENELCCQMDLAEDIDGGKRISSTVAKPKELIIEYNAQTPIEELPEAYKELDKFMRDTVNDALAFLDDHRYDPTEIYGDDLYDEIKNIPDPTIEPRHILKQFLYVLDQLGPYAADKAAFSLLNKLDKLKLKIPYERHFLLLCLCVTVFVKIAFHADNVFSKYDDNWEKIQLFSTPKVLRLAEILEKFDPPDCYKDAHKNLPEKKSRDTDATQIKNKADIDSETSNASTKLSQADRLLSDLQKCDFKTLGNRIEDKVNIIEGNLKDLDVPLSEENIYDITDSNVKNNVNEDDITNIVDIELENSSYIKKEETPSVTATTNQADINVNENSPEINDDEANNEIEQDKDTNDTFSENNNIPEIEQKNNEEMKQNSKAEGTQKLGPKKVHRIRGRGRVQRNNATRVQQMQMNPDALCGIVFVKEPLIAKIMFLVIVDMSRAYSKLSYLCAQYCAVETPADPGTELKECQRQGKKQEDVLKKFRMHDCNLLLATAVLEEGIDLPRCNLVLRWDSPPSYRSYGLCRARARAPRAACALLCEHGTHALLHNLATYKELDQIITRKCGCGIQNEPPPKEEDDADHYTSLVVPYTPAKQTDRLGESNEIERDVTKNVDDVENMNDILKEISDVSLYLRESVSCDNLRIDGRTKSDINVNITALSNVEVSERNVNMCRNVGNTKNSVDINDRTKKNSVSEIASVDLNTAIALINRYCGKLPSDTFTRLAPQWWMEEVQLPVRGSGQKRTAYICTLKLPLNCPVKYNIVGHPMPDRVLARRMVALQACRILHKSGELDNQLMPIGEVLTAGKENFKAVELENGYNLDLLDPNDLARPGTTKRRQYYFKRTAWAFTDCQPVVDTSDSEIENPTGHKENSEKRDVKNGKRNMLYAIVSSLWCALPERYNTRGRRLHAPQHAQQAIGILMARHEPDRLQIPSFPVYTRSGEVRVSVEHVPGADVRVSPRRGHLVRRFMRFVFSEVLRVRRRGMKLQNEGSTHNNYYIVPTIKIETEDGYTKTDIDWAFLELIYQHTEQKKQCGIEKPILLPEDQEEDAVEKNVKKEKGEVKKMENPLLKPGETFVFDADRYREAVVTPWYRNQDQPQYFLVAEICWNLSPDSAFPSATHTSFRHYYSHKYGVELTQPNQPLLDVDHTSARLNLLTPRYVNRKGVALPVSSERTRRAKRDRLDQKQILVPELCTVHPFAAPLWFATVSLPCVLYRINALLIADEIRRAVAIDVGLGIPKIDDTSSPGFQWPPLDFGWSLSEVLNAEYEKSDKKKEDEEDIAETIEDQDDSEEEEDVKEKTINDILQEKEDAENSFEIGTWSNDMASSVPDAPYDELLEPLPPNLTLCTSASGGTNWCDPVPKPKNQFNPSRSYFSMADSDCSYMTSDFDTDDSDLDSEGSDEDDDLAGFCRSKNSNAAMGVRIEYKTAHEAEAVDVERNRKRNVAPQPDAGDDIEDRKLYARLLREGDAPERYKEKFRRAVDAHKQEIVDNGLLIEKDSPIHEILPETKDHKTIKSLGTSTDDKFMELFPYQADSIKLENNQVSLEDIEKNKRVLLAELKKSMPEEEIKKLNCFSMIDVDIDSPDYVNEKVVNVGFDTKELYEEKVKCGEDKSFTPYYLDNKCQNGKEFDFDYQPSLEGHPGPSPSVILQALTMSNANDGINLERLETIGDSFLKFAITAYLYCAHPTVHEGKLSHMRSKQVSNLNLYRLGRNRRLGARMIASKFEPHDNWLPPCHRPPPTLHPRTPGDSVEVNSTQEAAEGAGCFIPYNLITQHSIPDKSIADCVEALIGAYLLECGPRGALLFMSWLGIRVLPLHLLPLPENHPYSSEDKNAQTQEPSGSRKCPSPSPSVSSGEAEGEMGADGDEEEWRHQQLYPEQDWSWRGRAVGSLRPCTDSAGRWVQPIFGELKAPPSPLLRYIEDPEGELEQMLSGYEALERTLQYRFKDRSLLLQALTHASHHNNRLTDCYQRLEFLGDAILDYLITRHLYEDPRRHSPGALTDLRSALVNNTIFATLAARHGFHKYFRHMSPGLNEVLTKYVRIQEENGHSISEEHYLIQEDEMEQAEDVEVPKALGDLFESVAGAIFLDSGMSLGAVWRSYVSLMGAELEAFSAAAPKSPVRELLEAEPDTAKFGKPERLADGRRVRVCVEVFGRGSFKGIGRNYRIAKGTAARCALRHLRLHR